MAQRNFGKWFGRLPGYGKALVAVAVVFLILDIVLYAYGSFGSTRIQSSAGRLHASSAAQYHWTGGTLLLDNPSNTPPAFCEIDPGNGQPVQRVSVPNQSKRSLALHRHTEVSPLASGSATVTCSGGGNTYINARSGSSASIWKFVNSWTYRALAVLLVVIPLVIALVIAAGRRRQHRI
jgi:hypothetical protein